MILRKESSCHVTKEELQSYWAFEFRGLELTQSLSLITVSCFAFVFLTSIRVLYDELMCLHAMET